MSAADLAAVIVALVAIVGLVVVLFAVASLVSTLRSLRDTIEAIRVDAVPAVADLRRAAHRANGQLDHVDELLATAESVSATVDATSRLTYLVVSNPLIKIIAFGAGAGRAARRLRRRR